MFITARPQFKSFETQLKFRLLDHVHYATIVQFLPNKTILKQPLRSQRENKMSPTFSFFFFLGGGGGQVWWGKGPVHGPRTKASIASFGFVYFPYIFFTVNKGYMSTGILFFQKWWNQILRKMMVIFVTAVLPSILLQVRELTLKYLTTVLWIPKFS